MANVYEIVTAQILEQLKAGEIPWRKPWSTAAPMNLVSQKEYRGINTLLLGTQGYASPYWLTYNQASKLGGNVKQGAKSSLVTFWKFPQYVKASELEDSEPAAGEDSAESGSSRRGVLFRFYRVFNLSQTEGIAEKLGLGSSDRIPRLEECEKLVANMPNRPAIGQHSKAFYSPANDVVGMPERAAFESSERYYATLFHELTHSTGHASRINREFGEDNRQFGSESYSKEELIAELGSAMLCGICGISPETIDNSAAYLQSWIRRLEGDSKLIVSAASAAQKAADYIRGIKPAA